MATGLLIRDAQGNIQRVPFDQLQQTDPGLYSKYVQNVQQPQAQLQETQAQTGAAGASAAASSASAAKTNIDINQMKALKAFQSLFENSKGGDNKVSPQTYNATKAAAGALGIGGDAFDNKFEQSYTNPNNYNYDTPSDINIRQGADQAKRLLQTTLDSFNAIPDDQKGLYSKSSLAKVPLLGQIFAPQATEYEKQRQGLSAQLKDVTGAGQGSGIRVTQTELNNWSNLLPSPTKTKTQNNYDVTQLNGLLKAKFGEGFGLDSQYLPANNKGEASRPPLSSFHQ